MDSQDSFIETTTFINESTFDHLGLFMVHLGGVKGKISALWTC